MSINTGTVDEALFGRIRRGLLGLILLNPMRSFYLLELVSLLRTGRGGVQRELAGLVAAGIVTRRREGVKVLFSAAVKCPLYSRLRELLQGMTDPSAAIAGALDEFSGRVLAAVLLDAGGVHSSNHIRLLVAAVDAQDALAEELERIKLLAGTAIEAVILDPAEAGELLLREHGTHWALNPSARWLRGSLEELIPAKERITDEENEQDLFSSAGLKW